MSSDDSEKFAPVHIDSPGHADFDSAYSSHDDGSHREEIDLPRFWKRIFSTIHPNPSGMRGLLGPEGEDKYRMMPLTRVLEVLRIRSEQEGYLDDTATDLLRSRLNRFGMAMATGISGPLRLRISDVIPIVDIDTPCPTRYSSITICLYLIAWMLQGDKVTDRDMAMVDDWIEKFDPKAEWSEAAKGTLRWLLSRKLVLTYKRKQRLGRLKRYQNIRAKLLDILLRLISDPEYASQKRMKRLETIYAALDLNPAEIHADIHRLVTTSSHPTRNRQEKGRDSLDPAKLRTMSQSTRQAQEILASVFAADQTDEPEVAPQEKEEKNPIKEIISRLSQRDEWTRREIEKMAKEYGMTLGAMLERVNDLSYEIADDALADDDDDTIYIDRDIAMQCLGQ